jgi:hypothetical protein
MRASQNALGGSSQLSMSVHRMENGDYEAESPSIPWAGKIVAPTLAEATQALRTRYQEWVVDGCKSGVRPDGA